MAIKAMAAKLARLVYRMLRYGMQFVDKGAWYYEQKHRQRQISSLKRKAAELGFQLVAAQGRGGVSGEIAVRQLAQFVIDEGYESTKILPIAFRQQFAHRWDEASDT